MEQWRLAAPAPILEGRVALEKGPSLDMRCAGARTVVQRAGGTLGVLGSQVAWTDVPPAGWPVVPPRTGRAWHLPLVSGGRVEGGPWGWGLKDATGRFVFWRSAPGALSDALYDGRAVWAVGVRGLWRWVPGRGLPGPVVLPPELAGQPLSGLFRDGHLIWVRSDGRAWPLLVRGTRARLAGRPGAVGEPSDTLILPAGEGVLQGTRGVPGLELVRDDLRTVVLTGVVWSLARVSRTVAAVGVQDRVELWWFGGAQPVRLAAHTVGSAARRLFVLGEQILVFTQRAGFVLLDQQVR